MLRTRTWTSAVLVAAVSLGCTADGRNELAPLHRSCRTLQAATASGVSFQDLHELVRSFSAELLIAGDLAASDEDKQVVAAFLPVLKVYEDSLTVWQAKIDAPSYWQGSFPYSWRTVDLVPRGIVEQYKLKTKVVNASYAGSPLIALEDDSVQRIWAEAAPLAKAAVALYLAKSGKPS